jgi:hypothetical protein
MRDGMGKASRRKHSLVARRFDEPSEWGRLRVPPAEASGWVKGAEELINATPLLWPTLIAAQRPLIQSLRELDWAHRSGGQLVEDFHILGNINEGVSTLLPSPHNRRPLDQLRAFYLANFIMHGCAALAENPAEDFGWPNAGHLSPWSRAVLPALRPLSYMLAHPAIIMTIQARLHQHQDGDAALLALDLEGREYAERRWFPLLGIAHQSYTEGEDASAVFGSASVFKSLMEQFALQDRDPVLKQRTGDVASELIEALAAMNASAGDLLADVLSGSTTEFGEVVKEGLRRAHTQEAKHHKVRIRFTHEHETIRHRQGRGGLLRWHAPEKTAAPGPTPEEKLLFTDEEREAAQEERDQAALRIREAARRAEEEKVNQLPNKLRRLYMLKRQNPTQSIEALARRLGKSTATIRNWHAKLTTLLSQ